MKEFGKYVYFCTGALGYELGDRGSIPGGTMMGTFSLRYCCVQADSGVHPASFS